MECDTGKTSNATSKIGTHSSKFQEVVKFLGKKTKIEDPFFLLLGSIGPPVFQCGFHSMMTY